jgi:hypothetical protein
MAQSHQLALTLQRIFLFVQCHLFMYTNINTNHALQTLQPFLSTSPLSAGCPANTIITALDILMQQNIFKLGAIHSGNKKPAPPPVHHPVQIMPNSTTALGKSDLPHITMRT